MAEEKRIRRSPEQIAADLDQQIETLQASITTIEEKKAAAISAYDEKIATINGRIKKLEQKKKNTLTPKKRKPRKSKSAQIKDIVMQAKKAGLGVQEIAAKLGVSIEE